MRSFLLFIGFICSFAFCLNAQTVCGEASYYSAKMNGNYTSTGETYRHGSLTCANSEFPVGTILRVTRFDDSRSVDVRVNDCISPNSDHIVVLSGGAAAKIGLVKGAVQVSLSVVKMGTGELACGRTTAEAAPTSYETSAAKPARNESSILIRGNGTYPASILEPVQSGYGVQIGSYKEMRNASDAVAGFQDQGFKRLLIRAHDGAYQVLMGPFETESAADVYRANLSSRYKINGFVTSIQD